MATILDHLRSGLAVVQDDAGTEARDIEARGLNAAQALRAAGCTRVALAADNVATMLAALLACEEADCEIVLLRDGIPGDATLAADLNVSAMLDAGLSLRPIKGAAREPAAERRFRILVATSGTGGAPKIAVHTLDALTGRIRPPPPGAPRRRWLLTYHPTSYAGLQVLLTALFAGDDIVAVSRFSVPRLAEVALTHRPTSVSGTPTFWRSFLLTLGARAKGLELAQVTLGGEPVDQATLDRLRSAFPNAAITHIYASTEAGSVFAVRDGRAGFPADWLDAPIDGVRLRVRDGILQVDSPRGMERYIDGADPANAPLTADGWLVTGDRVERRGDRMMFLGRADATINVGGMKVSPEEIEAALLEVRGVVDVHAYGRKNPITGYLVSADVVLEDRAEPDAVRRALAEHARARLDAYKVPRVIRFIDGIDRSAAGKKARRA